MVPHSARGDGPGELPACPRVRARARRHTGGYRLGRARPAGRPDEPSASRAGQPGREPGGAASIEGHDPLAAAGGSLRDVSRVAAPIRRSGSTSSSTTATSYSPRSPTTAGRSSTWRQLEARDGELLGRWIDEAAGNRRRVLRAAYAADPGDLYRVRAHVPDAPGVLASVTQALGAERINIEDFELHHLSPERGGVLGILVAGGAGGKRRGIAGRSGLRRHRQPGCLCPGRLGSPALQRQPRRRPLVLAAGVVTHVEVAELEQPLPDFHRRLAGGALAVHDDRALPVGDPARRALVDRWRRDVDRAGEVRRGEGDRR